MNRWTATVAFLTLVVILAGVAVSQDVPLLDRNEKVIPGKLDKDYGSYISITTPDGAVTKMIYSHLHPKTVMALRAARTPAADAHAQWDLAEYGMMHRLYDAAVEHFQLAVKADPSLGARAKKETARAERAECAHHAHHAAVALRNKDHAAHRRQVAHVVHRYPGSHEAAAAEKILDQTLHVGQDVLDIFEAADPSTQKLMEKFYNNLYQASEARDKAMKLFRKMSRSIHLYKRALGHLKHCVGEIKALRERVGNEPKMAAQYDKWKKSIGDLAIDIYINVSDIYMSRGSYVEAQKWATKGLEVDGNNARIKSQLSRVRWAMTVGGSRWGRR